MPQEYHEAIAENNRSTLLLFGIFIALIAVLGFFFGLYLGSEPLGLILTFALGTAWGLVSWFAGDSIIMTVSGAKQVAKSEYPYLFNTVEGLAIAAGVPTPELYVIEDPSPNAFATGRDPKHGKIAVTTGLLKIMDRDELEGVLAHEMSHIRNLDIRTMMLAAVMVGIVSMLGNLFLRMMLHSGGGGNKKGGNAILLVIGLVFIIASPFIAQAIRLAISRKREYLADASAVELTRNPDGIKAALQKLLADHTPLQHANDATSHLYIEDPVDKDKGFLKFLGGMFSTHPPLESRIAKLDEYGKIG